MMVEKQHLPSQGPPQLLYLQNSKQQKMIRDAFPGQKESYGGKKMPQVTMKRLENKLPKGNYR